VADVRRFELLTALEESPIGVEPTAPARSVSLPLWLITSLSPGEYRKYNPAQLRDPGGEDGGRWVKSPASTAKRLVDALSGQAALDATPAKLKRAPGGHHGDYTGEDLTGPPGMGSVRALSEYEGVEYQSANTFLRGGYKDARTGAPASGNEDFLEGVPERIAEIDKTMAVSRLTADVKVSRVIKEGKRVFGEQAWWNADMNSDDFDVQDAGFERWQAGERPDLTGLRWKELGYSSTTADPAVAEDFGKRWPASNSEMDGEPVIMTILVPKGTGGVQLAEMGHAAEILLQRDLTYEVVADDGVGSDGFRRIQVRVVPDGE